MYKIKFLKLIILSFCVNTTFVLYSQQSSRILIYANKSDFLIPFIKKSLEEMTDNKNGLKIFSQATNLNLWLVNSDSDKLLKNGVKKLLSESNFINKFKISFTGNYTEINPNRIFASTNDTVNLKITDIFDYDTEIDKIDFKLNFYDKKNATDKPYSFIKLN